MSFLMCFFLAFKRYTVYQHGVCIYGFSRLPFALGGADIIKNQSVSKRVEFG